MIIEPTDKYVLVADYGRSGQGWLSFMLCYILNAKYIEPYNFLSGTVYSSSERILSLTRGNLLGREKTDYSLVIKTHEFPADEINLTDKVIFLVRDPRDVAVSMHNLYMINLSKISWKNTRSKISLLIKKFLPLIDYLIIIFGWKKHYYAWKTVKKTHVRYEDMLNNAPEVLKKILVYLNINVGDSTILEAVNLFAFEITAGRPRGQEDENNPEFRKGISGDYKNKLSGIQLSLINYFIKNELIDLKYEM